MMTSFLKTNHRNFLIDDFEKFVDRLNQKSSYELHLLKNNHFFFGNEEQDWSVDHFGLVESQIFKMKYQRVLMEVAGTSISLTLASKN